MSHSVGGWSAPVSNPFQSAKPQVSSPEPNTGAASPSGSGGAALPTSSEGVSQSLGVKGAYDKAQFEAGRNLSRTRLDFDKVQPEQYLSPSTLEGLRTEAFLTER